MKSTCILALALVASASSYAAGATKKKVQKQPAVPVAQKVLLATSSDSVSYAGGMTVTNGLVPYLVQQQGVDTTYMADFVRGLQEVLKASDTPKMKAYLAGMDIARQLKDRMLPAMKNEFQDTPDSISGELFYRGFTDALQGDTTVMKQVDAEYFFHRRQEADQAAKEEKLYGPNREAGKKFLAENALKDSVVVLPSGLQYKVLVKGEGDVPTAEEKVFVNYEGRLIDGTVFDASNRHGDKPAEFTPTQVIKGWTEALTMMPVGSKWQLYVPYELAYGNRNTGTIKPYSTLIFDVELVGIDRPQPDEPEPVAAKQEKGKKQKKSKKQK